MMVYVKGGNERVRGERNKEMLHDSSRLLKLSHQVFGL